MKRSALRRSPSGRCRVYCEVGDRCAAERQVPEAAPDIRCRIHYSAASPFGNKLAPRFAFFAEWSRRPAAAPRRYRRPSCRRPPAACSSPCRPAPAGPCAGPRPLLFALLWLAYLWASTRSGRDPARAAAGLGRADRRPAPLRHPARAVDRGPRAAPADGAVPACRLDPPAGQPDLPADLRPAGRTGDGAVAVPAAVPAGRRGRQPRGGAGDRRAAPAGDRRQRRGLGGDRRLPGAVSRGPRSAWWCRWACSWNSCARRRRC